jgi:hypothetical protein
VGVDEAPDRGRIGPGRDHEDARVVGEEKGAVGPPDEIFDVAALQCGLVRHERSAVVAGESVVRGDPQKADAVARDGAHLVGGQALGGAVLGVEKRLPPPRRGDKKRRHDAEEKNPPHGRHGVSLRDRRNLHLFFYDRCT